MASSVLEHAGGRRGKAEALGRSSSPWSTRRAKTSWIEGRPRVESGWWDWIGGNEGNPRKKGRWVAAAAIGKDGTRGLGSRV